MSMRFCVRVTTSGCNCSLSCLVHVVIPLTVAAHTGNNGNGKGKGKYDDNTDANENADANDDDDETEAEGDSTEEDSAEDSEEDSVKIPAKSFRIGDALQGGDRDVRGPDIRTDGTATTIDSGDALILTLDVKKAGTYQVVNHILNKEVTYFSL
jgi:hypothetical protein